MKQSSKRVWGRYLEFKAGREGGEEEGQGEEVDRGVCLGDKWMDKVPHQLLLLLVLFR